MPKKFEDWGHKEAIYVSWAGLAIASVAVAIAYALEYLK